MRKSKRLVLFVMILSLAGLPPLVYVAQAQTVQEAVAAAERDAEADTDNLIWIGVGFVGGPIGVGFAYIYQPSPPAMRFMGKSPEYVAAYTDAYKRKVQSIQTKYAFYGCLGSGALYAFYILFNIWLSMLRALTF